MSVVGSTDIDLIEQLIRMATTLRSAVHSGLDIGDLYVTDPVPKQNPLVEVWTCQRCSKNFYGHPTVHPRCPDCDAPLVQTDTLDLRTDAFRPFTRARWGVR